MLIIRVELHSAITGAIKEIARMYICNDGTGTASSGNYLATTFRGRNKESLGRKSVQKATRLLNWRRQQYHDWNLVCKMLIQMGYTQGHG
jgi:hypothetical protein